MAVGQDFYSAGPFFAVREGLRFGERVLAAGEKLPDDHGLPGPSLLALWRENKITCERPAPPPQAAKTEPTKQAGRRG